MAKNHKKQAKLAKSLKLTNIPEVMNVQKRGGGELKTVEKSKLANCPKLTEQSKLESSSKLTKQPNIEEQLKHD